MSGWPLFDSKQRCHRQRARNRRQREQQPILPWKERQEYRRHDRTDNGASVIHRTMEAEDAAAGRWIGMCGEHRIARSAANALSRPVQRTDRQHLWPRRARGDERPGQGRQGVAEDHNRPALPAPIGHPSRRDLQQTVDAFRDAFDDAQRRCACTQHAGQIYGQQRIDHFGRGVGEETGPPEQSDGTRDRAGHLRQ